MRNGHTRLTVEQAADFLLMHPDTLKARARTGEIKGYKPGRRWVFLKSELLEYLKSTEYSYRSSSVKNPRVEFSDLRSAAKRLNDQLGPRTGKQQPRRAKFIVQE